MGLYDGIKDVAKVVQQADNIELYQKLLDLSSQALEMQNEISRLTIENAELKKIKDIESKIIRHQEPYLTLTDDANLMYCTNCWDSSQKLVQLHCDQEQGTYNCPCCKDKGVYDVKAKKDYFQKSLNALSGLNRPGRF